MMTLGKKESGRSILPIGRKVIDTSFSYGRKINFPKKFSSNGSVEEQKKKSNLER